MSLTASRLLLMLSDIVKYHKTVTKVPKQFNIGWIGGIIAKPSHAPKSSMTRRMNKQRNLIGQLKSQNSQLFTTNALPK